MKLIWIAAAALAAMVSAPAAAQRTELPNPEGAWVHAPSGVSFPAVSGNFKRAVIQQFASPDDVGVVYHLAKDGKPVGIVSVYVYPASSNDCAAEWAAEKAGTEANGDQYLSEDRAPSPSGKTPGAAYHAKVDMHLGQPGNPITSASYFYCVPGGKWLVKYYSSWKGTGDLEPETVKLMRSIGWPAGFR
ncbi:MAG: hypothetical protein ACAH11_06265 [Sphingomonas sp.]